MPRTGKMFIISAPSGAGKTTVVTEFVKRFGNYFNISRVVTYTTKKPHESEKNEVDYYFLSEDEFIKKTKEDFFIEWSTAYGNYYGSPKHILHDLDLGKSYFLVLDQVGGYNIIKQIPGSILVWLSPADIEILRQRLVGRSRDSKDEIDQRLLLARQEIVSEVARSIYKYHIISSNLESSIKKILKILKKELQM